MPAPPRPMRLPTLPLVQFLLERHEGSAAAAAAAGVNHETVNRWRNGSRQTILLWNADRVAVRLGVHPMEIWGTLWLDPWRSLGPPPGYADETQVAS